jgi:hypothetical protein
MSDYPASLDVRPLTTWPGDLTPAHRRAQAQFSAKLSATLSTLTRELNALGCRHPVLEVAIPPGDDWRIDGRPRANARPAHPGVVLSIPNSAFGPLRYATDTFTTWQDNLRAIALGLEALRKVDRYGITKRGEQYAGFRELPAGSGAPTEGGMTQSEARNVIYALAELPTESEFDVAIRRAKRKAHPDLNGGQRVAWDYLEAALRTMGILDQPVMPAKNDATRWDA